MIRIEYILGVAAALAVAVAAYWLIVPAGRRPLFLLVLSVLATALINAVFAIYFLVNIAIVYAAAAAVRQERANRKAVLVLSLVWLVGNLCFFKYGMTLFRKIAEAGLPPVAGASAVGILFPMGMSYVVFRLVHYMVESYRGNVPRGTFTELALYVIFFPTFLAGPVDRFQRFQPQVRKDKRLTLTDANAGLQRIFIGLVRKFIVADYLGGVILPILRNPEGHERWIVILSSYGVLLQLYMDFGGYTDMALGISKLFGFDIMENFNKPLFQKNIAMFWRNWHISVYTWIRDYFFFPLFGTSASTARMYIGIVCSMTAFMLWHGATLGWVALGLYHSAAMIVLDMFQNAKKRSPALRRFMGKSAVGYVCMFLTFSFTNFGIMFFTLETEGVARLVMRVFAAG